MGVTGSFPGGVSKGDRGVVVLSHQRPIPKPRLEAGLAGRRPRYEFVDYFLPAKVGLGSPIVVAGALFTLFRSALSLAHANGDWRPLLVPPLLCFTTSALILSSLCTAMAAAAKREGTQDGWSDLRLRWCRCDSRFGFLGGQIVAWVPARERRIWSRPQTLPTPLLCSHCRGTGLCVRRHVASPEPRAMFLHSERLSQVPKAFRRWICVPPIPPSCCCAG